MTAEMLHLSPAGPALGVAPALGGGRPRARAQVGGWLCACAAPSQPAPPAQRASPSISSRARLQRHTPRPVSPRCRPSCPVFTPSRPPKRDVIFLLGILRTRSLCFVVVHINFSLFFFFCPSYLPAYLISSPSRKSFLMTGVIPYPPLWPRCTRPCQC